MNPLTRRQEEARGKYLAVIREQKRRFQEEFPAGSRVEFKRPPATPEDPSIRTGTGTILRIWSKNEGLDTYVEYTLDPDPDHPEDDEYRMKKHQCKIGTFLQDKPVRIQEMP